MNTLSWTDFEKVELRVGTILHVEPFPEAKKPAYKITVDFGEEIGIKKSSAQITVNYTPQSLVGTQVVAVVNFPPKQIGPFFSQCLITGFCREDGSITLARPEERVPNGSRLL